MKISKKLVNLIFQWINLLSFKWSETGFFAAKLLRAFTKTNLYFESPEEADDVSETQKPVKGAVKKLFW